MELALDLLEPIREGGEIAIELAFGLGREFGEIGILVVLDVAAERVDADDATERKVVQEEQGRTALP